MAEINKIGTDGPTRLVFGPRGRGPGRDSTRTRVYSFKNDSVRGPIDIDLFRNDDINGIGRMPGIRFKMERGPGNDQMNILRYRNNPMTVRSMMPHSQQTFEYSNMDKEGFDTHVSYRVAEARDDVAKKISGVTKSDLELQDLMLAPQFSAGKTLLSFSLPVKTVADVQLSDSEGKVIWKDKATTGSFSKSFVWSMNGVYYLTVKQGAKAVVKRIIKED